MDILTIIFVFIFGLIVGAASSRFGIGGAIMTIPFLRIVMGLPGQAAIATALPLTIPTALSGAIVFHKRGLIRYKTAIVAGLVGSVFSVLGAIATTYFTSSQLMIITSFTFFGLAYIISQEKKVSVNIPSARLFEKLFTAMFIGSIAGFSSGFLGIGGGVILVPLLVIIKHLPLRQAIPTSLATMAIYAIPGSITHYMIGNVHTDLLTFLLLGSIMGARISAERTLKTDEKELRKMFSILLMFLGLLLLFNEFILSLF